VELSAHNTGAICSVKLCVTFVNRRIEGFYFESGNEKLMNKSLSVFCQRSIK
jgi:hypothetical protein